MTYDRTETEIMTNKEDDQKRELAMREVDGALTRRPEAGTLMNPLAILGDPERATEFIEKLDTDKLEKLMELYDQQQEKQAEREFNAALARFQSECPQIEMDKSGVHSNPYASMQEIRATIDPHMAKQGLSFTSGDFKVVDGIARMTGTVRHVGGHSFSDSIEITADRSLRANDSQKSGSAASYCLRYLMRGMLGLVFTDDPGDDDGQAAGTETISDEQCDTIMELLAAIEDADESSTARRDALHYFEIQSWTELPERRFREAQSILQKKLKKAQA